MLAQYWINIGITSGVSMGHAPIFSLVCQRQGVKSVVRPNPLSAITIIVHLPASHSHVQPTTKAYDDTVLFWCLAIIANGGQLKTNVGVNFQCWVN